MDMYEKELPAINALICVGNDHISSPIFEYIKRSGGARVTVVTNAIQAINELYDHEYHFFLIAQEFPGCDGVDLVKRFKDKGFINKRTRQIMLLEEPNRDVIFKARAQGIEHILIPPFTLQAISDRMKTIYAPKRPKALTKGVGMIAKNVDEYADLKAKSNARKKSDVPAGGMKIHAPEETANLILKDQKIIRKPRRASAHLAQKSEPKMYQGEKRIPNQKVQKIAAEPVGQRPIEALPPYPGMTKGQKNKLMQMTA